MQVIGVSQDFPNPAKRRARATRAQADIGIARADEAVTAQDVRLAPALAWVALFYAKKRLQELDLPDDGLGALQATVTARSEERRDGKGCGGKVRFRVGPVR